MIPLGILASQTKEDLVPAVVTNSVLWLDAADLSTITESSGSVSQWDNKGSLGNFTQGSGALQPTTGVSTLNGLNVLNFAADYLTAANTNEWKFLHDGTDYIAAAVWKAGTTASPGNLYGLFGNNAGSGGNIGALLFYDDRGGTTDRIGQSVTNGTNSPVSNLVDNFFPGGTFAIVTSFWDPDNATAADRGELYKDDGSAVKNNSVSAAVSAANPTFALQIGTFGNNVGPLTGSIAELVIVSGADATETNRVIIRDYLNAKWGVYV